MNEPTNTIPACYANTTTPFRYIPARTTDYFTFILGPLGITSNFAAFIVVIRSSWQAKNQSRSFFLIFLAGMVVIDLLGLVVTFTFMVVFYATSVDWRKQDPTCHFCNFMGISFVFYGLCPLLLGASMSIERYIGIIHPFKHSTSKSKRKSVYLVLIVWLVSGAIAMLPVIGFGSYHIQTPGSWCFFNISSEWNDKAFGLLFSLIGLISLIVSFLLNTVSVVTLLKVCWGLSLTPRGREREMEMMVQLVLITVISTICWSPLLIYIFYKIMSGTPAQETSLSLWIRFAATNQVLDPWVYILFRSSFARKVYINFGLSEEFRSSVRETARKLTRKSNRSGTSPKSLPGSNLELHIIEETEKTKRTSPSASQRPKSI